MNIRIQRNVKTNNTMKKYTSIIFFLLLGFFIFSCQQNKKNQTAADTDDLLELPPPKKINQSPPKKINATKGTSTGIFTHLEQGDYYYFHIKNGNKRESFMLRNAYDGSHKLNIDNWRDVKGKTVKITWKAEEEKNTDDNSSLKYQKVLAVDVLD